jgi:hypothetical protein
VHRVSQVVRNVTSHLHTAHKGLIVTGAIAATFAAGAAAVPAQAHSAHLRFHRGYTVQGNWLCYGWNNGTYHCTQHWQKVNGKFVSHNPSWVPSSGHATTSHSSSYVTPSHSTPVHQASTKSAPVNHTPAPATSSASTYYSANPGTQGVIDEIRSVFGPYSAQALTIARCESSYNPNAYNPTPVGGAHAAGVFQILDTSTWRTTSYAGYSPYNASANIHAAYQIFQRDGYSWREWQCRA